MLKKWSIKLLGEIFITLFSATIRPTKLKLGTRGQWKDVYQNRAAASYLSLYFSFRRFSNIKDFRDTF